MKPALSISNVRLFIAFKVFFNSRFYYPVFTILFLDFGLTIAQFSILNAVWAASIVLAEIPLGALADIVGRKRLLVLAAFTMMVEIGIICVVPTTHPSTVFIVFLINRALSGLAEAAASGADEAIAYDALVAEGDPEEWGKVLEVLMRFQSIGFIIAMGLGAAVYDPHLMQMLADTLGIAINFNQTITMRIPLYLTFFLSVCALITTLKMTDITPEDKTNLPKSTISNAFAVTFEAGRWILKTPFALRIILFGMLIDSVIRMVITLSSQYYRVIGLPEASFGIIGALVSILGIVVPKIARRLAENRPVTLALWLTAGLALTGLTSMNQFWPIAGLLPAVITFSAMYFNGFFVSYYINRRAKSSQRATVLSFKGLSYNICYGLLGTLYALWIKFKGACPDGPESQDQIFMDTFFWFPLGFAILFAGLYMFQQKKGRA